MGCLTSGATGSTSRAVRPLDCTKTSDGPCSDRDGRVTLRDLAALAEQASSYARQHALHECQAQLQGACTLRLYWEAAKSGGAADFVTWWVHASRCPHPAQAHVRGNVTVSAGTNTAARVHCSMEALSQV